MILRSAVPILVGILLFLALPVIQGLLEVIHVAQLRSHDQLRDLGYPFAQPEAFALVALVLLTMAVARARPRGRRREPPDES